MRRRPIPLSDLNAHIERINAAIMAQCEATVDAAIEEAATNGAALLRQRFDAAKATMVTGLFRNYDVANQQHAIVIKVREKTDA